MTRGAASFFYHTDHLGSVRLVADAAGAVANSYDYDAFGNLEATSFETVSNPFGFTARERDAESGIMFYRARYYDPKLGRFISQDPIGFEAGDLNLYRYVYNFPSVFGDPNGKTLYAKAFYFNSAVTLLTRWTERYITRYVLRSSVARGCYEAASDFLAVGQVALGVFGAPIGLVTSAVMAVAITLEANFLAAHECQSMNGPSEPIPDDPFSNLA